MSKSYKMLSNGLLIFFSLQFGTRTQRLTFANISPSSSYSHKEVCLHKLSWNSFLIFIFTIAVTLYYLCFLQDIVSFCKRRGGSDDKSLSHNEWLQTVQLEPDVISMSFIPITSLLNGVPGSGFLSHAINLYLRCEQCCYCYLHVFYVNNLIMPFLFIAVACDVLFITIPFSPSELPDIAYRHCRFSS